MKTLAILALLLIAFACSQTEELPARKDNLTQAKEFFEQHH